MMTAVRRGLVGALVFVMLLSVNAAAHEIRTPVIVDTDMALDDVRALTLMLHSPHVQVKAIVTSDGSSSPQIGCVNLLRVLRFLEVTEIPVGVGRSLNQLPPPWRARSESLGWADLPTASVKGEIPDAVSLIISLLQEADENVTYVCLGPMTNLADAIERDASVRERIQTVIFYGTLPGVSTEGWNTARDPEAIHVVSTSGVPVYFLHLEDDDLLRFDPKFLEEIGKFNSRQSRLMDILHQDEKVQKLLNEGHFRVWDEAVALFLDDPSLGNVSRIQRKFPLFVLSSWDRDAARNAYLRLLSGPIERDLSPRIPVVLERYPTDPKDLQEDVRSLIPEVITRHGLEEWKATLLTNELHRHMGIYSILGAKMGIRARELLGASLDELRVESHAGLKPPLSCMNDGLQVSTGATLGRGTIRIMEDSAVPAAIFTHGEKRLYLRTKEDVLRQIQADIRKAIDRCGALTPEYFEEVRRLSLRYWLDMDRQEIFEEQIEVQTANN